MVEDAVTLFTRTKESSSDINLRVHFYIQCKKIGDHQKFCLERGGQELKSTLICSVSLDFYILLFNTLVGELWK